MNLKSLGTSRQCRCWINSCAQNRSKSLFSGNSHSHGREDDTQVRKQLVYWNSPCRSETWGRGGKDLGIVRLQVVIKAEQVKESAPGEREGATTESWKQTLKARSLEKNPAQKVGREEQSESRGSIPRRE